MSTFNRDEVVTLFQEAVQELFNIPPEKVTMNAHLVDDLELDSIDAIDLAVKLQQVTGKKLKPEEFKSIRTVEDMVNAVERLVTEDG